MRRYVNLQISWHLLTTLLLLFVLSVGNPTFAEEYWPHESSGFGLEEELSTKQAPKRKESGKVTKQQTTNLPVFKSNAPALVQDKEAVKIEEEGEGEGQTFVDISELPKPPTTESSDSSAKQELVPLPRNLKVVGEKKGDSYIEVSSDQQKSVRPLTPKKYWDFAENKEGLDEEVEFVQTNERPPYQVGIGDRLLISIYGEPNTERDVVVDRGGNITYPIIGKLQVMGKTIDQLHKEMDERIRAVYRYTFVNVTPVQFGRQSYTILGEVNQPGRKLLLGKETVLSALCRAGGFTTGSFRTQTVEMADLEHAFLMRNGEYVPVDFEKLVIEGDLSEDVALRAGDYIYLPSSLEKEIFVLGEVAIPSSLGFVNKISMLEALALAGGTTYDASSRAVVVRGSLKEPYTFHIDINLMAKGVYRDFELRPGDIVYVPPRQFTLLRQITEFAVRTFVSTFASDAGTRAFNSIINGDAQNSVNIIPSGGPGTFPVTGGGSVGGGGNPGIIVQ